MSLLRRYWADIDTQLRRVAYEKRVKVRLLISCWASTQPLMFPFLKSLASVYDLKSKLDIQVVGGFSACRARGGCLYLYYTAFYSTIKCRVLPISSCQQDTLIVVIKELMQPPPPLQLLKITAPLLTACCLFSAAQFILHVPDCYIHLL